MYKTLIASTIAMTFLLVACDQPAGSNNPPPTDDITPPVTSTSPVEPTPAPTAYELGERTFGRCIGCHGVGGKRPVSPQAPALAGKGADWLVSQLQAFKSGERQDTKMGVMNGMASGLSEADMHNIATYLSQQPSE